MRTYRKSVDDCSATDLVDTVGIVAGSVRNIEYRGGAVDVIAAADKYSNLDQIVVAVVDQRNQNSDS